MPFLPPNQQRQSTEGLVGELSKGLNTDKSLNKVNISSYTGNASLYKIKRCRPHKVYRNLTGYKCELEITANHHLCGNNTVFQVNLRHLIVWRHFVVFCHCFHCSQRAQCCNLLCTVGGVIPRTGSGPVYLVAEACLDRTSKNATTNR